MLDHSVRARLHPDGYQVVHIVVDGGYRPDGIIARAGIPIRLVFRRDDDDACTERVVFSGPRLDRRLAPTGTTTVHLPAQPPGLVRFTCGMGRYRGSWVGMMESATGLVIAIASWLLIVNGVVGVQGLTFFVALIAYIGVRQGLLRLRSEARSFSWRRRVPADGR